MWLGHTNVCMLIASRFYKVPSFRNHLERPFYVWVLPAVVRDDATREEYEYDVDELGVLDEDDDVVFEQVEERDEDEEDAGKRGVVLDADHGEDFGEEALSGRHEGRSARIQISQKFWSSHSQGFHPPLECMMGQYAYPIFSGKGGGGISWQ